MKNKKNIGLVVGILLLILFTLMPTPLGMTNAAKYTAGVCLLMTIWWITDAIPIYVTAFVPIALFPLYGILSAEETTANYGENFVFMLLAGLILAKAVEKQNLHKRIALHIVSVLGVKKRNIILGFMIASSILSMWIANVAVALLMLPLALAVVKDDASEEGSRFSIALLLSIAYSSSIGGACNLIGTPPNMIMAGVFSKTFPNAPEITFLYWLKIGFIVYIVFMPIIWFYLCYFFKISGNINKEGNVIKQQLKDLGAISKGEVRVFLIFALTGLGWVFRKDIVLGDYAIKGWSSLFTYSKYIHDSTIAIFTMILLFFVTDGKKKSLLDWKTAQTVPWGVVIIVGGGYALSQAFNTTGLAEWIGKSLVFLTTLPSYLMLFAIIILLMFITEINSNTATANIFLPIIALIAVSGGVNPLYVMVPATFAISYAFMLPSGSGTNTAIFASEKITIAQMASAGFWLNIISVVVLTLLFEFVIFPLLGVAPTL